MQVYLVGGAVRDQLLGYPVYDRDWVVVGATTDEMLAQGFQPVGSDFPVFIHPKTGEEYALARTERKSGKGYTGFQYHAAPDVTLEEDLCRRDLTINAMAQTDDGTLIDPYHGQQDLEQRILRHVSPAFAEDPLRVLRVARFAARYAHLGFHVADETLALMRQLSAGDELDHLTAERVWKETERALGEKTPYAYLKLLEQCGALKVLLPEWLPLFADDSCRRDTQAILDRLASQQASGMEVFSCLTTRATDALENAAAKTTIEQICKRLRTPKAWQEQAVMARLWHQPLCTFDALTGEARFGAIQALDLLRRPQRLPGLLACCQALNPDSPELADALEALLARLNGIAPATVMAEGFKGKALGDELNRRRTQLCETFRTVT